MANPVLLQSFGGPMHAFSGVVLACVLAQAASAQTPAAFDPVVPASSASMPSEAPTSPPAATFKLAAGTELRVELLEALASNTSRVGATFVIRLAEPITDQGKEIIDRGAPGQGEIIDAARAGIGGRQGKLIIAARYLELNGRRVRIRGMTIMASGRSHVDLATGVLLVPYVGLGAVFIKGGDIQIPEGSLATVRVAEDVDLPLNPSTNLMGKSQ